jgi:4-carboxymuconolactone decarboxylase
MVELAASIATGDTATIRLDALTALAAGVPPGSIDELVLQSVLTVGWPRALVAAEVWREVAGRPADDVASVPDAERQERGEGVCRVIYGAQYDQLRHNVRALHPQLDDWMIADGYGRTLSRSGLSLALRELCTVVQTIVLNTPRQLHSHLLGALRAGATTADVDVTVACGIAQLPDAQREPILLLWQRVRARWKESG